MRVPVLGARLPAEGASGGFLFHRREDHFHQGLDIGTLYDPATAEVSEGDYQAMRKRGELPILSILDGEVVEVRPNDVGSYGRLVVVRSLTGVLGGPRIPLWHLYSHCSAVLCSVGDRVVAGETIALVGWSGNAGRSNPHLHFEIATSKLPTTAGPKHETTPTQKGIRIDPRRVLAALPPFGTRVFSPSEEEAAEFVAKHHAKLHADVEKSRHGGYFPLGANNTWHGGVHLPFTESQRLFCPLDGQIVAARLDPDPATSTRQHGSTNFILVRHEVPEHLYHHMRGTTPAPSGGTAGGSAAPKKRPGIGGPYDNDPDLVERAREALRESGHYPADVEPPALDPGAVEPALIDAIESFQSTLEPPASYTPWPDGSMRYEGFTWDALFEDAASAPPTHPDDETNPSPPHEPEETDTSLPPPPPPPPQEPERVVYSLFMHLAAEVFTDALAKRFPWLQAARLFDAPKAPPPGIEADLERARLHREDIAEAAAHRLTKHVGQGDENPDDVRWVRKRLHRFEILPADNGSGELDPELRDAVLEFQQDFVYPKRPAKADGVVSRGRRSDMFLRRSRRQLGIDPLGDPVSIDPLVRTLLSERGVDGMARVVDELRVPIVAGDPLWSAGEAGGFTDDGSPDVSRRVHWAMFSEHPIFVDGHDGWASIVDGNEDLTADAPRTLIDLVADWPVGNTLDDLPPDGIIDPRELAAFYADSASNFLRRRQCHFRTEWGLDVEATVRSLEAQGWAGADSLKISLLPYQWWFDAAAVLPAGTHVWHYNPIEFLATLRAAIEATAPEPPKNRDEYGSVRVRVLNERGGPATEALVQVIDEEGTTHEATTSAPARNGSGGGVVDFPSVRAGACTIVLTQGDQAHPIEHESVRPGWDANVFTYETTFDGPDPVRGDVRVTVRRHGSIFEDPVDLQLVDGRGRLVDTATSKNAKATFTAVAVGEYVVRCVDGESDPLPVTLDRARAINVVVRRRREPADLLVTVLHNGSPAPSTRVVVTDHRSGERVVGGLGLTDGDGRSLLHLRQGRHHARVGRKKAFINLVSGKANEVLLEVDGALTPDPPLGMLEIQLLSTVTVARVFVQIFAATEPAIPLFELFPSAQGLVAVDVPAGGYRIVYDGRERTAEVVSGDETRVEL